MTDNQPKIGIRFGLDFKSPECQAWIKETIEAYIEQGWQKIEDDKTLAFLSPGNKSMEGWHKDSGRFFHIPAKWVVNLINNEKNRSHQDISKQKDDS